MTDPGMDAVERQIREAKARGAFDDLPGAGKPLQLGRTNDPDWWIKGLMERERLDSTALLPSAMQLRKEGEGFPESLAGVAREETVREILSDFNKRVRRDRTRPVSAGMPQVIAPIVDVDEMVVRWSSLRAARVADREVPMENPPVRRRWWRRRR